MTRLREDAHSEMSDLLEGVRVVELGDGDAGGIAGSTLALLGAEVTRVDTGASRAAPPLRALLDFDKRVISQADLDAGAATEAADIVFDDRLRGVDAQAQQSEVQRRNRSVWVTISPFGLSGPDRDRAGSELVALASGGVLSTVETADGSRPVALPDGVGSRMIGQVAALAALHGMDRFRGEGRPVHVDVSAQEAAIHVGSLPECAHAIFRCPGRAGSGRYVAPSGVFPCRDGSVRVAAIENHQWQGMVESLGEPEWTKGLGEREARAEHADLINERVAQWTGSRDKAECADLLQRHGVPATAVNGPADLLESPQYRHRDFFRVVEVGGVEVSVPGAAWVTRPGGAAGESPTGRVAGLRVLELTHVLAGPIVGALLGAMGADVVRLEDRSRLDIYRRTGPFADGIAGPERGAYFAVSNHSKRSVAVDEVEIAATTALLLERSQALVENVGAKRLAKTGVDLSSAAEAGRLTMSVSGFGADGPLSGYRVYANNVHAYGGLADLTRDTDGALARLGTVLADPLAAVTAATVVAAWALGPNGGRGANVDLSMAEVVTSAIGAYVVASGLGLDEYSSTGAMRSEAASLSGVFATSDGWVAFGVEDADEMRALRTVLGLEVDGPEPIEDAAVAWLRAHSTDEAVTELNRAGLAVSAVNQAVELLGDAHLAARRFFARVDHPDPDLGEIELVGVPWRFAGEGPIELGPPPGLGSANRDLLEGVDR